MANEAAVPLSGQNRSLRLLQNSLSAHGRPNLLPSSSWRFSRCRFLWRLQCSRMAMYFYCQGSDLPRSRGAKIIEDRLNDFFAFVCQAFQYLTKHLRLCAREAFSSVPFGIQKVYSSIPSRFCTHIIVQGQSNNIVINCLPRNLKAICQFSCLDFFSLAKDFDDGFSAPICVHILSPPRSLLQLYRTRIMSNIPLHFFKIISRVSKS